MFSIFSVTFFLLFRCEKTTTAVVPDRLIEWSPWTSYDRTCEWLIHYSIDWLMLTVRFCWVTTVTFLFVDSIQWTIHTSSIILSLIDHLWLQDTTLLSRFYLWLTSNSTPLLTLFHFDLSLIISTFVDNETIFIMSFLFILVWLYVPDKASFVSLKWIRC